MNPHKYGTFWIKLYLCVVYLLTLDACSLDMRLMVNGQWSGWICSNIKHAHDYEVDNIYIYDHKKRGHHCVCTLYPIDGRNWPPSGFIIIKHTEQHLNDEHADFIYNFTYKNTLQRKPQFKSHCNTDVTSVHFEGTTIEPLNVGNVERVIITPHGMTLKIVCSESGYPTTDTPDLTTPTVNSQTPAFIATTTAVPKTVSTPRQAEAPTYSTPRHTVTPQYDKELDSESSPRKDSNNLLILAIGVAVGALLLFIVVIAIVIICVKKRSREGQAMVKYVKNTDTGPQYMNVPNHEQGPEYADASTIGVETGTEYAEIDIKRFAPKPQPNPEATDECAPGLVYADLAFETEAAGVPTNPNQATVNGGDALTDDDIAALYAKPMKKPKSKE